MPEILGLSQPHEDQAVRRGPHPDKQTGPLIFISAAEDSADLHGAALIKATKDLCPSARFVGVAGPRMLDAGCELVFDMAGHAAMLLGALANIGRAARMLATCDQYLRRFHFDAAVVIDSPTLHLPLAGKAHALGIPVLYYVAPQMWAWGAYRIYKLRHRADRVAVILPFEEEYFRNQGVDATFVGHPLAEKVRETPIDADVVQKLRARGGPLVALLPGSRRHVVQSILPAQLAIARRIRETFPHARFGVSVANQIVAPFITTLASHAGVPLELHALHRAELVHAADLVLAASGTSTLEVAFYHRPMIVMYNASRMFYHLIGRWLIHTPFLSLPNILAGREVVPEFMPYVREIDRVAESATNLLSSPERRARMSGELESITKPLRNSTASLATAELLLSMIQLERR